MHEILLQHKMHTVSWYPLRMPIANPAYLEAIG